MGENMFDFGNSGDSNNESGTEAACRRIIFHIDVNSAFLSWSAVKRLREDPTALDLRTIPSAVGGDVETRHGVITAKSLPAKKYGVKTGEPVVKALQKCPSLLLIPSDFATYRQYSNDFMDVLRQFTPVVEQVSIDESFLDATAAGLPASAGFSHPEAALALAAEIRARIRTVLGFTVNVGISTNKLLAKTASDFRKPDRTHTLFPEEVPDKLWTLPIEALFGCGHATADRLRAYGVTTIGDAAHTALPVLQAWLGEKSGEYIHRSANGLGSDVLETAARDAKSYSNETTTAEDITADNYDRMMPPLVKELADHVGRRLKRDDVLGNTVTFSVKTDEFRRRSRQTALERPTDDGQTICDTAMRLSRELLFSDDGIFAQGRTLRLVGVGVSGIEHVSGTFQQMDLTEWVRVAGENERQSKEAARRAKEEARLRERDQKLQKMMESIGQKYGEHAVRRGQ